MHNNKRSPESTIQMKPDRNAFENGVILSRAKDLIFSILHFPLPEGARGRIENAIIFSIIMFLLTLTTFNHAHGQVVKVPSTSIIPVSTTPSSLDSLVQFDGPTARGPHTYFTYYDHEYDRLYIGGWYIQILDYSEGEIPTSQVISSWFAGGDNLADNIYGDSIYFDTASGGIYVVNRQDGNYRLWNPVEGIDGANISTRSILIHDNKLYSFVMEYYTGVPRSFIGLMVHDLIEGTSDWITRDSEPVSLPDINDNYVTGSNQFTIDGETLYFTTNHGIWYWNLNTQENGYYNRENGFSIFEIENGPEVPSDTITAMLIDNEVFYLGTHQGLFIYNSNTKTSQVLNKDNSPLIDNMINYVDKVESLNSLFISCENGGLLEWNLATDEQKLYTSTNNANEVNPQLQSTYVANATYDDTLEKLFVPTWQGYGGTWVKDYKNTISFDTTQFEAVRALYHATGGDRWADRTNWPDSVTLTLMGDTEPLPSLDQMDRWKGVTIRDDYMRKIELPGNELNGFLPLELASLDSLEVLDVTSNQLSEALPVDLATLETLDTLKLAYNEFDFGDLEPFFESGHSLELLEYYPQNTVFQVADSITTYPDSTITITFETNGQFNMYQWEKFNSSVNDYESLSGFTQNELMIDPVSLSDSGMYRCKATNEQVVDLVIYTNEIHVTVQIDSLPPPTVTTASSCTPAAVTLTATGEAAATINWYEVAAEGTPVATGETFITPELTENTYYYASQSIGAFESERAEAFVRIGPTYEEPNDTTICQGQVLQVYATGEGTTLTWSWNEGQVTTDSFADDPDTTRTYAYHIEDENGCYADGEILVTVLELPEIGLTDTTAICPGEPLTLEALEVTDATYLWEPGGYDTRSITVTPTEQMIYDLTVTSAEGCESIAEFEIPFITFGNNTGYEEICIIDSVELVADGADSYLWMTGETTQEIWYKPDAAGTQTVTVDITVSGCTTTQEFTVEVAQYCPGTPRSFQAYGTGLYTIDLRWTEPVGNHDEYVIEQFNEAAEQYEPLTTLPTGTNTYTHTGLEYATRYYYRMFSQVAGITSDTVYASGSTFYPDMNYIREISLSQEGVTNPDQVEGLPYDQRNTTWTYLDGIGEHIQTIVEGETPQQNDMVQPVYVDQYGRSSKQYLSYTTSGASGNYRPTAIEESIFYYENPPEHVSGSSYAYAETRYENSPRGRVLEQGGVGASYQLGTAHTAKSSVDRYLSGEAVIDWTYNAGTHQVTATSYVADGLLAKSETEDAEGNISVTYTDDLGRQVVARRKFEGGWMETYNIYDLEGKLLVTLPPLLIKEVQDHQTLPYTITSSQLDGYAFQYVYDAFDRVIEEKTPGVAPTYFIYDDWDRPVLSQDGNQRANNQWVFTKYDFYDRSILSGTYTNTTQTTRAALQTLVDDFYTGAANELYHETEGTALFGYTNRSFPTTVSETDLLTVSYFDDYDFVAQTSLAGTTYTRPAELGTEDATHILPEYHSEVKGQATGSLTRILDSDQWLATMIFYDDEYRAIQVIGENHLGGKEVVSNQYDFVGNVRKVHTEEQVLTTQTTRLLEYEYDHADRLSAGYHTMNGGDRVHLFTNHYNELGELISKQQHGNADGTDYAQTTDYAYSIHGWLESINGDGLSDSGEAADPKDLFNMKLLYDTTISNLPSN